jgi:hypothetical protein
VQRSIKSRQDGRQARGLSSKLSSPVTDIERVSGLGEDAVVNFSRRNKDLEERKYNKIRKEVNNTELKGSSKRKDWRRRSWEQFVVGSVSKVEEVPCVRRNCSIGACSVKTRHTRDMLGCSISDVEPQCTSPLLVRHEKKILLQLFFITCLALIDSC